MPITVILVVVRVGPSLASDTSGVMQGRVARKGPGQAECRGCRRPEQALLVLRSECGRFGSGPPARPTPRIATACPLLWVPAARTGTSSPKRRGQISFSSFLGGDARTRPVPQSSLSRTER